MIHLFAHRARTSGPFLLCALLVAAPGAYAQEPVIAVVEPAAPVADPASESEGAGFFLQAFGGMGIPVTGPLSEATALGLWAGVSAGLGYRYGLAGFVELGIRHHPVKSGNVSDGPGVFDAVGMLVGGRLTVLQELQVHPFGEAGFGVHWVTAGPAADPVLASATPVFALLCSAGLQIDLTPALSIEGIIRADLLFTSTSWSSVPAGQHGNTLFLSPMLRGSLYF